MRKKIGREIALLCLPVLVFGGAALWKNWRFDPHIYVDSFEVGAVSLERELLVTSVQAQRRVHLAVVANWNISAALSTPEFEVYGRELRSFDEELRASNGKVWRSKEQSLSLDFQPGGELSGRSSPSGRRLQKLHWMVIIPADAPKGNLKFSAKITAPGLEKKEVTFLARPAWRALRASSLQVESIAVEKVTPNVAENERPSFGIVVRLRYSGIKPLFCDGMPMRRARKPQSQDYSNLRTMTPGGSSQVATFIWAEAQWVEDNRGRLVMQWRRAQGGDMNYNIVRCQTPYLDAQGFILVRYVVDEDYLPSAVPLEFKAQLGIVEEGILPISFAIPPVEKPTKG